MLEYIIMCIIIIFKDMCDKTRGLKHIVRKRSVFNSLVFLIHLFCFCCGHTCAHTHLSHNNIILFTQRSTTITNHTITSLLPRAKNFCVNQLFPNLNHLWMFDHGHMEYFYPGNLVKGRKINDQQKT